MAVVPLLTVAQPNPPVTGLPLTRTHPFDEIGNVSRSAALNFDAHGRLAVIQDGACFVLNDDAWTDVAEHAPQTDAMVQIAYDSKGNGYYGALASWGTIEHTAEGKLRPRPLRPSSYPSWVSATNFSQVLCTSAGVYFAGSGGMVFWDRATGKHTFFEIMATAKIFQLRDYVFVSSHARGVQRVKLGAQTMERVDDVPIVDVSTPRDDGSAFVSTFSRRLGLFDGKTVSPWSSEIDALVSRGRSNMLRLSGDRLAIAIYNVGLFIVSTQGMLLSSFTGPEYLRIRDLAANEPGILWISSDKGIEEIFYGSPVTVVDHRMGVPIDWPRVVRWQSRTIVDSAGRLYESLPSPENATTRFRLVPNQPPAGAWAIAAQGDQLLVGNPTGVYARLPDGSFSPLVRGLEVSRLIMAGELCYALGGAEITALRFRDGKWQECANRIPSPGFPAIAHGIGNAAWIELGANRVARVQLRDGALQVRLFEKFPWSDARWVNVGAIGHTVVLSGPPPGRLFFDETTESIRDDPKLQQLLAQSPHWITRVREDKSGTIWASHESGVVKFVPTADGYRLDTATLDLLRDRFPLVQVLDDGDVWISSESALYHVDRGTVPVIRPPTKPVLIAIVDQRTGRELDDGAASTGLPATFRYAQNNLGFRFFAGTYALAKPSYRFRVSDRSGEWSIASANSVFTLPNLKEGSYRLEATLVDLRGGPVGQPFHFGFHVKPPWFRSWYSYVAYATLGGLAISSAFMWSSRRARRKQMWLESLVAKRTNELRITMEKLNSETRNAATLEERNRLAGEIHDSVQQGLTGLMLQLDTMLRHGKFSEVAKSQLQTAINMVSFSRDEVKNAVWDMESPLLETGDLGEALRRTAGLVDAGGRVVDIAVRGAPRRITPSEQHQLLRIAQEAVTNAVRHSAAQKISVSLDYETDRIVLRIVDNGCGFALETALTESSGHFGLRGLRNRASKINAEFSLVSAPGQGTTVQVTLPLSAQPSS